MDITFISKEKNNNNNKKGPLYQHKDEIWCILPLFMYIYLVPAPPAAKLLAAG